MIPSDQSSMTILDTHTLVWFASVSPSLGKISANRINEGLAKGQLGISTAVIYELHWLEARGRLTKSIEVSALFTNLQSIGVQFLDATKEIARTAALLSVPQGDPIDRLIAATAIIHHGVLVTADYDLLNGNIPCQVLDARL